MKKIIIDTNALISFVTDRNRLQQEKIAAVFDAASLMKVGIICHQQVVTEFVYVMEKVYRVARPVIHNMLGDLIAMPGVEIVHDLDMHRLMALWPAVIPDFGDAVLAATCKQRKEAALLSFDAQFAKAAKKLNIKLFPL